VVATGIVLAATGVPTYADPVTTAAALIIGDEILSGKVRDANTQSIIDLMRELGVELRRIVTMGDDEAEIAAEIRFCSERFDAVITSGGVGPTHDDRTVAAVARAFGVGIVRNPELERMIRCWWADRFTDGALRMADIPQGAELLYSSDGNMPLVVCRNVYMLPGIPRLFHAKIGALRDVLKGEFHAGANLYLSSDESAVAHTLSEVDAAFPQVKIGSYPRHEASQDHQVWITVEAATAEEVNLAVDRLLELLPPNEVMRVERG
jgi:molybdenum cofactor synthesis domain-containing protein